MKKILFFMAIVSFTSFGLVSCSEDDPIVEAPVPNPNPNVGKQLKVSSSATYIKDKDLLFSELGKPVKFTTTSGSQTIADATYYVDGVEINSDTYSQSTIGE